MANKIRIEVCRDKNTAQTREEWLKQRGYNIVRSSTNMSKVIWDARDTSGVQDIAFDDDDEVWIVEGEK